MAGSAVPQDHAAEFVTAYHWSLLSLRAILILCPIYTYVSQVVCFLVALLLKFSTHF